jgi:hypothetical protein
VRSVGSFNEKIVQSDAQVCYARVAIRIIGILPVM